jgi:hypothetical protein
MKAICCAAGLPLQQMPLLLAVCIHIAVAKMYMLLMIPERVCCGGCVLLRQA